jgi:hypothetical protein
MSDDAGQRGGFKRRLQGRDQSFGNLLEAETLMESVWRHREMHGSPVGWREAMHELKLLLVW